MVLTKPDILKQIEKGNIVISPFNANQLNPNSYDVTLGDKILIYTDPILDAKKKPGVHEFTIPDEGMTLYPGEVYIGCTNEYTETKGHVPVMYGKSSLGRLGLAAHWCAGLGDQGFKGKWTLELVAVKPIRVYKGMPIAQIAFTDSSNSDATYDGKYQGDTEPGASKYYKNFT